ncbi:MAG: hypothetical protein OEZ04_07055 [Nitrospinota bacterium]|nr:hypothetical protein [Nitrospinota bacterium]
MQDIRAWIDFTVQKENKAIDLIYSHQDGLYVDGILRPLPWAGKDLNVDTEFYDLGNGWWIGKSSAHIVWLTPDVYDGDNFHYLEWYTFQGTSGELSLSGEGSPPVSLEYDIRIRYPSRYWNKKDGLVEAMVTHYKESDKCGYAITREVMLENIGDGAEVGNACSGPLLYIQKVDVGVFLITPLQ